MTRSRSDLLQGTLDLLILKTLQLEPMHGWGITERIESMSGEVFKVNVGSLYPALQRLTTRGLICSDWQTTENNRRAKFYSLTRAGRKQLKLENENWDRLSQAVRLVMEGGK